MYIIYIYVCVCMCMYTIQLRKDVVYPRWPWNEHCLLQGLPAEERALEEGKEEVGGCQQRLIETYPLVIKRGKESPS